MFPEDPRSSPYSNDAPSVSIFENLDRGERSQGNFQFDELNLRSGSQFEGFKEGNELDPSFDSLNSEEGVGAKRLWKLFPWLKNLTGKGQIMIIEVEGETGE